MSKAGKTGVTSDTPKNIMFGAGTIHKDLTFTAYTYELTDDTTIVPGKTYYTRTGTPPDYVYTPVVNPVASALSTYYERSGGWSFDTSIIGATQGGSKISIKPEITSIDVDGALVPVKGLKVKTGETATMEFNFLELTKQLVKTAIIGDEVNSGDSDCDLIESKAAITAGDYYTNIGFIGQTLEGKNIMVIMDNALCTSGFESSGKNKEAGVFTCTFECHADLTSSLDKLPYHIYFPTVAEE